MKIEWKNKIELSEDMQTCSVTFTFRTYDEAQVFNDLACSLLNHSQRMIEAQQALDELPEKDMRW